MKREDKLRQIYGPGAADDLEEEDYESYLDMSELFDGKEANASFAFGWNVSDEKPPTPICSRISLLRQALILASRGWRVFPLCVRDKVPATAHGVKDASDNWGRISAWWKREPEANIGLSCDGEFFVIDADDESAVAFVLSRAMPEPTVWTARGAHWYLKKPEYSVKNSAKGLVPGIKLDIRSTGGYVVVPPSLHPSGARYRWGTGEVSDMPFWLDALLQKKISHDRAPAASPVPAPSSSGGTAYGRGAMQRELARLYRATEGERNNQLNIAAFSLGQLVGGGQLSESTVEQLLLEAGTDIGLGTKETRSTVLRALADGAKDPRRPKEQK